MAEPRRFQVDSNQRSVGVPTRRRSVWLWIAVSLALHGAIVLFALVGAARGGHSELAGTFEVTVVGPPSAGEPDGGAKAEKKDAQSEPESAPARPEAPPEKAPPTPALPQPAQAPPPAAAPSNITPPQETPKPMAKPQPAEAPDPIALPRKATPVESEPSAPRPDTAEPAPKPQIARPPEPIAPPRESASAEPAPREPRPDTAETTPKPPEAPAAAPTPTVARPKAARESTATPRAPKAATRGVKKAPEGQTASLGTPNGGERLGRSDTDENGGLLNINLNPRFRSPPPPPVYPRQSIERDEEGVVLVRALVDPMGAPQRVLVVKSSGFPLLDEAALAAVQKWRFEPMIREGRASAAWVQVPVRFRLN